MVGLAVQYDVLQHRIVDADLIDWLKRQVVSDERLRGNLFLYRHLQTGNFIVAVWVNHKYGAFREIMNLGLQKKFPRWRAGELVKMLQCPLSGKELVRGLRQEERNRISAEQEKNDEKRERIRRARSSKMSVSFAGAGVK
jgi:hypothetical protein